LIYLDTHVVVWIYAGLTEYLTEKGKELINDNPLYISGIVSLEIQYFYEIGRITEPAEVILLELANSIGLTICEHSFRTVINHALAINWTRDPFDRIIVANATVNNNILLSKDKNILNNYIQSCL
jgi:PIN domain nuclease of toxin-antitoxin system